MKSYDYVIVGGGPAGTFAATHIREKDKSGTIAILTDEPHELYSRVLLPNYLKGQISLDKLYLRHPEFYSDNNIQLHKGVLATELIPSENKLTTSGGDFIYKKLLLANGGKPSRWEIPGAENNEQIFNLRTIEDADKIKELLKPNQKVVLIGGGFITLEFVNVCLSHQIRPTVLVREKYLWANMMTAEQSKIITDNLNKLMVDVYANREATQITKNGSSLNVATNSDQVFKADFIGVGIGIDLQTKWLKESGISVNKGILTNEYLQTSIPNIWAAGDIAEYKDTILDSTHLVGNWTNANEQGKVAGDNMVGAKRAFNYISNYSINSQGVSISFVGSVIPDEETELIKRQNLDQNKSGQLFMKKGKLIGATLINMASEKPAIMNLISSQKDLTAFKSNLIDTDFELSTLS